MLYIIKNKPYIKVSNYYKEVSVDKIGNDYSVVPVKGEENRIYIDNIKNIVTTESSVEDFFKKSKHTKKIISEELED